MTPIIRIWALFSILGVLFLFVISGGFISAVLQYIVALIVVPFILEALSKLLIPGDNNNGNNMLAVIIGIAFGGFLVISGAGLNTGASLLESVLLLGGVVLLRYSPQKFPFISFFLLSSFGIIFCQTFASFLLSWPFFFHSVMRY